jgi:hypothetical protein
VHHRHAGERPRLRPARRARLVGRHGRFQRRVAVEADHRVHRPVVQLDARQAGADQRLGPNLAAAEGVGHLGHGQFSER